MYFNTQNYLAVFIHLVFITKYEVMMQTVFSEISNSNTYQVYRPLSSEAEQPNTKKISYLPDAEQKYWNNTSWNSQQF